ncbi:MAG: hypothetical protein U0J83_01105 [Bulleidia sp.]|nr:hypothetical protein [Bulleidia sp.]
MMKRYKRRHILILVLSILLGGIWIAGFSNQKRKYPSGGYTTYSLHEPFELFGCTYEVTGVETYDYISFVKEHNLTDPSLNTIQDDNAQLISVKVRVTNTSDTEQKVNLYPIMISTVDQANALELITYMELHDNSSAGLAPILQPGETYETELPYISWGIYWGVKEGNMIDKIPLRVTFTLYPEKYSVLLNDLW